MSNLRIVTLDGPAGVGKSTVARELAKRLGYAYLDTGAMYRVVALHIGDGAASLSAPELLKRCRQLDFSMAGSGVDAVLLCCGKPVGPEIRLEHVGTLASRIAVVPTVREYLQEAQRELAKGVALVAEGRDMGTKVFPHAPFKFFLDAAPRVRALRRYKELVDRGQEADLDVLTEQIKERDQLDRTRPVDPLQPAPDAVLVDTSELTIEEVIAIIAQRVQAVQPVLSHVDADGQLCMVDVGAKTPSERIAIVRAEVQLNPQTFSLLVDKALPKGDVLACAKVAGIMAAKRTAELIPLCHPVNVSFVDVRFALDNTSSLVRIEAEARCSGQTGVEMEAMLAAHVAAATLYDMCKAVQKDICVRDIRLVYKSGGKSGVFDRRGAC